MENKKRKYRDMDRNEKISRIIYIIVMISFLLPIAYLTVRIATGGLDYSQEAGEGSRTSYILMIVECILGAVVINVPSMLAKRLKFELPVVLYTLFIIFLYCAVFLGEVRNFYYVIPFWDVILHAFSSLMLGFFGLMFISILNQNENIVMNLSPFFVVLFAFCFAVAFNTVWEIYEFTMDGLMDLNMQKYVAADGTVFIGRAALIDTMKDIIVDVSGAAVAAIVGYFSIKNNRFWFRPNLTIEKDSDSGVSAAEVGTAQANAADNGESEV